MPEHAHAKSHLHPFRSLRENADAPSARVPCGPAYAELAVTTNYTFLTGASHPEEFVRRAAELGHSAAAITDTCTLAGIVRAHVAAKEAGVGLAVGSRVIVEGQSEAGGAFSLSLLLFAPSRAAYSNLCRLLTVGKRRAPKGQCHLALSDVLEHQAGLLAVVIPPAALDERFMETLRGLAGVFDDDRLSLAASRAYGPADGSRVEQLAALSRETGVPLVATNDVHYHAPERRALQDVLTCVRHGCTIEEAGHRLHANAERHLKAPEEMARLFAEHPEAVARAAEVALRAAAFSLDELRYEYPVEPCPPGLSPIAYLRDLTERGAADRYPEGVPAKVRAQIEHELSLIEELKYEPYFLTCYDIVKFARSRGILCQGRGGAANSAVCYCLGVTAVDPAKFNLLFERFVSRARNEPPDIDIDFEHERREEVIQYIYAKYGRERAALTAEVISYRGRSAVRDVGKAMGLSLDCVDALARQLSHWGEVTTRQRVREAGMNPDDPTIARVIELSRELSGFPRHLSQHVGGFVITRSPLCDLVPIENAAMEDRTVIEWDKDDIDAVGMLKVDVLGLGMLSCLSKCLGMVNAHDRKNGGATPFPPSSLSLNTIPWADPAVYNMICHADTIGVFQIESRAQMSMLPRLRPREFYDLVIEVAIVRPGPIQGKMVHPYLRRRNGEEPVTYPNPDIERVLGRTLGVPLFQEQAMQLAIVAAGFTPDEADRLRRAMAAWKRKGDAIFKFGQRLIDGMIARGYPAEFAHRCFEQIKGFSEYGFPESHAASFALLVYASAWLKRYHPAAFAAALINSQPMGFYQPAQIVRDAAEHGVEVRGVDVNRSGWDCRLEESGKVAKWQSGEVQKTADSEPLCHFATSPLCHSSPALRLGMRLIKGLAEEDARKIEAAVGEHGPFATVQQLRRASGVSAAGLRCLARADALRSMGLARQEALWAVRSLRDEPAPLFEAIDDDLESRGGNQLPKFNTQTHMLHDYAFTGLSLKAHPLSFLREELARRGVIPTADLRSERACPTGKTVKVAGVVLVRQRPGTASGVVFITLEDETGIANLILWPKVFERFRRPARLSAVLLAHGRVERSGEVVHVHVRRLESLDESIPELGPVSRDFH